MKISEEIFAVSSCSTDGSCTTSQGRLAAGGGAGSPVISNFMHSMILAPLACFEVAGCSFLWVLKLNLFFWAFHSCSTLQRAAEAQRGGEHRLQHVQRKPISPHPHQPPCTDWIIFLPLVLPRSRRGEAGERQGAIPAFSKRWCDSCHPTSADVMGMRITELCPHAALCKWIALISGGFPCAIFRCGEDNRGMSILMQTERSFRCIFPPGAGEKSRRRKTRQPPPAFLSLLNRQR